MATLLKYVPPVAAHAISARSAMHAGIARRREFGGYLAESTSAAVTGTNLLPRPQPADNSQPRSYPSHQGARLGPIVQVPAKPHPPSGPAHQPQPSANPHVPARPPQIAAPTEGTAEYVWWPSHTAFDRQLVRVGVPFVRKGERTLVYREREGGVLHSKAV